MGSGQSQDGLGLRWKEYGFVCGGRVVLSIGGTRRGLNLKGAAVRSIPCTAPLKAPRLFLMNALRGSLFHCAIVQGNKLICGGRWICVCMYMGDWTLFDSIQA